MNLMMITMAPDQSGVPHGLYPANSFEMRTLLSKDPGQWEPTVEAREAALMIRKELGGRTIVLVGRSVAVAFGLGPHPLFEWTNDLSGVRGARVAVIPCPDVELWWTDEVNRERACRFFDELLGALK